MPKTDAVIQAPAKKKPVKRRKKGSVMSCPVNGAGWCAYPFSLAQLEKRLKEKALAQSGAAK